MSLLQQNNFNQTRIKKQEEKGRCCQCCKFFDGCNYDISVDILAKPNMTDAYDVKTSSSDSWSSPS